MSLLPFTLNAAQLAAHGAGALWWPQERLLCVSDLHLGKPERIARRGGSALPPYEAQETLSRLEALITELRPAVIVSLGDSFDDDAAAEALPDTVKSHLSRLTAQQRWIWITGNHDPAPFSVGGESVGGESFGGEVMAELAMGPLTFRHIAMPDADGEISGHYHPKAHIARQSRACFLLDQNRLILPAFGTYTGGLRSTDTTLSTLMGPDALAILTGPNPLPCPMPRRTSG